MVIYIGSDHRGFRIKEHLKTILKDRGYSVYDVGNEKYNESDDYPDFAKKVGEKVSVDFERSKGILICGSGVGVDVVANKYPNVRSALVSTPDQAFDSRTDDDTNVLALGANYVDEERAEKIVFTWLQTPFSGENRHVRRIRKIQQVEAEILNSQATKFDIHNDNNTSY